MNRRSVLALGAIGFAMPALALAELSVLALRLVRPAGWEAALERDQCVVDDLYVSRPAFPKGDFGRKVAPATEHLWRKTMPQAAIPAGDYAGVVMRDGPLGWRIELSGTGARKRVQLHIGTKPVSTSGSIVLGVDAIRSLRQEYGETDTKPVLLRIEA